MNDQTTGASLRGNAALEAAINPHPKGRSSLFGFTVRAPKPAPPVDVPRRKLPVKAARPVDGIPAMFRKDRFRASEPMAGRGLFAVDARAYERTPHNPPEAIYGPAAVIEELARHHVTVALSADRLHVVPVALGGRFVGRDREMFEAAAPLLLAHLRGEVLACQYPTHKKGTPPDAVTILAGGCPACAVCLAGGGK